jgi:AAA15 family ATPase/GTPase
MSVFFNSVQIRNFKSLKDATLPDCKRINVLIGKPNVGKSNILEAIGLFSLPYIKYSKSKKITQFVKLENLAEMFFDGNTDKAISIIIDDKELVTISSLYERIAIEIEDKTNLIVDKEISDSPYKELTIKSKIIAGKNFEINNISDLKYAPAVKFFKFPKKFYFEKTYPTYLLPPSGINLFDAAEKKPLKQELAKLFHEYNLKLLFDKANHDLRIVKELDDNSLVSLPFNSIADTLQRIVFFKAAIASNTDSILLFEEPEAHCFPPYIAHFTQEVIHSESNQFFIATHSPYVLNDFLERKLDELAVFFIDYQNGQTVINRLTDAELNEVYDYGIDVFFNYERFTRHE